MKKKIKKEIEKRIKTEKLIFKTYILSNGNRIGINATTGKGVNFLFVNEEGETPVETRITLSREATGRLVTLIFDYLHSGLENPHEKER